MDNNIEITDSELWCIIVGLEMCSGEDFDPLLKKMKEIRDSRKENSDGKS